MNHPEMVDLLVVNHPELMLGDHHWDHPWRGGHLVLNHLKILMRHHLMGDRLMLSYLVMRDRLECLLKVLQNLVCRLEKKGHLK